MGKEFTLGGGEHSAVLTDLPTGSWTNRNQSADCGNVAMKGLSSKLCMFKISSQAKHHREF